MACIYLFTKKKAHGTFFNIDIAHLIRKSNKIDRNLPVWVATIILLAFYMYTLKVPLIRKGRHDKFKTPNSKYEYHHTHFFKHFIIDMLYHLYVRA